ncbi:putative 6-hydroxy-D-nicotine oxidase [Xylariaceae sp. FL1019]|nr:putative 6-hydroxy-D-nicotine oxidase [Xylariaceae sp. FL1019]
MAVLRKALLAASALTSLAAAQTFYQDGQVIAANEDNVAPAAESVNGQLLLTDAVLENLGSMDLSNISLFSFPDDSSTTNEKRALSTKCKTFPGDLLWPSKIVWKVFDLLTGGALIKTVPIGAACYPDSEHYDAERCSYITDNWHESLTHASDPTSAMSPLFQGKTCMPENGNTSTCELGGFPSYAVNISTPAQIQLAINFARNTGVRLIVKNTGHDFLGKSVGAGALSIWTHNLKDIEFIENYKGCGYTGKAIKLGAGVEVGELYAAADKYGVSAVGGECKGVGVAGGYTAGGGHSPLSSLYGMGADQVLSIDIVLPDGRFVTADKTHYPDVFWAARGGGGGTFGVVTSMTVKVHPKMTFSGLTFYITTGNDSIANTTTESFMDGIDLYWRRFPEYAALGHYGYSSVYPRFDGGSGYTWEFHPWLAPGSSLTEFKKQIAPLMEEWKAVGFNVEPVYFEYDNLLEAWSNHFPTEYVANADLRTGSRLVPAEQFEDSTIDETIAAFKTTMTRSALIMYNMNPKKPAGVDNAVNPAWRDTLFYVILGSAWTDDSTTAEIQTANEAITNPYLSYLDSVSTGSYLNEADVAEPQWQQMFWGDNYDRLLKIKQQLDPWDTFWAPTAVGSEGWYVTDQESWLQTQNGRLCKK